MAQNLVIVSHRHRFIFLRTRKTGSTSVHIALSSLIGEHDINTPMPLPDDEAQRQAYGAPQPQNWLIPKSRWDLGDWIRWARGRPNTFWEHTAARTIARYLPDVWAEYYKFAFDRNPWDLVVSAYFWHRRRRLTGGNAPPSFEQFIMSDSIHAFSNWQIYTIDNVVAVDDLFRFEDGLEEGLKTVATHIGLTDIPALPKAKSYDRPTGEYHNMFTHATRTRVAEVFRREIEYFGWKFE